MAAKCRFAHKAVSSYYSLRKSSKSISPPINIYFTAIWDKELAAIESSITLNSTKKIAYKQKNSAWKGKITSTCHPKAMFKFWCFF